MKKQNENKKEVNIKITDPQFSVLKKLKEKLGLNVFTEATYYAIYKTALDEGILKLNKKGEIEEV